MSTPTHPTGESCVRAAQPSCVTISLDTFRQQSLDALNAYRQKHGTSTLTLNSTLNDQAQKYAGSMAGNGIFAHSGYALGGEWTGENLYWSSGSSCPLNINGATAVDVWYNEINNYSYNNPVFGLNTGHFTQAMWKDTNVVGFGRAVASNNALYVVANFFPGGNYPDEFVDNVLPPKSK